MLKIVCDKVTPRVEYAVKFLFGRLLNTEYRLLSAEELLQEVDEAHVSYTAKGVGGGLRIPVAGLLVEEGIRSLEPDTGKVADIPVLFPGKGDLGFDVFSAVFWMITRYEEYLPARRDKFGRFPAMASLAYRKGFLEKPVVNVWAKMLREALTARFPELSLPKIPSAYLPTLDIDNPWAHRNKGIKSWLGGSLRQLSRGKISSLRERMAVLRSGMKDPFDSYDMIKALHHKDTLVFILAGSRGKYDNRISLKNENWRKLILSLDENYHLGFHPSFRSNKNPDILREEKKALEAVLGRKLTHSRQHFLILSMPGTYRALSDAGIEEDYSMGFPERPGFRAGTSSWFYFYDLEKEVETGLRVFPFCVMDRTLKDYMDLDTDRAWTLVENLIYRIRDYGGNFIPVWHNESLGSAEEWKKWPGFYLRMHNLAKKTLQP